MRVALKDFQTDAVASLREKLWLARGLAKVSPAAVLLNAPTGSGKTLIATALIQDLLSGAEGGAGDADTRSVFLWLTDQPELNKQTLDKMRVTSSTLAADDRLVVVDASLDVERLEPGKVYFLNTQKLGTNTSYVRQGDRRTFTLWETLSNTIARDPERFVLVIDEAHRGAKGRESVDAETIMQKLLIGNGVVPAAPVVLGISATPDRFVQLCARTKRPVLHVDVPPQAVRESGLLKEYVYLHHPQETQPSDVTMLRQAIASWREYERQWKAYAHDEGESVGDPVLVIQVADAKSGASGYSTTDLESVVKTIRSDVPELKKSPRMIAHAFQDASDIEIAGLVIRHIAPSEIDADPEVRVVLFKTSLNTGWDCPRAEVMVSFRSAKDETNIAQLVGRMVRAPLARRIEANDHLNTVSLYLPLYNHMTVQKVIDRLTTDADAVPPTLVQVGGTSSSYQRAPALANCFEVLEKLPSYAIPRGKTLSPVTRLARLAAVLSDLQLLQNPIKAYRTHLVRVLLDELAKQQVQSTFDAAVADAAVLDVQRKRLGFAPIDASQLQKVEASSFKAPVADENVDDLYDAAGRKLGEGLHREYLRSRLKTHSVDARRAKLELHALLATTDVLGQVEIAANSLRKKWSDDQKAAIQGADERYRQAYRDIVGSGASPELIDIRSPAVIEAGSGGPALRKHLFVDSAGDYCEDLKSSWERRAIADEIARKDVVGWLRNPDRRPWSLCIPRQEGNRWVGVYPDFIVFRRTPAGIVADVVDPHLLSDAHAPSRAAYMARFAAAHHASFGRIELVIYGSANDQSAMRLDLVDEKVRAQVATVSSHSHLKQMFDDA